MVAADLSGDSTFRHEILGREDLHDNNRVKFKLGEGKPGRLVAKVFTFRLIYGGGAWSYANDPDFMGVSTNTKFWQRVIDQYYEKYDGLWKWHQTILASVKEQGFLEVPSGRYYNFVPQQRNGEWVWPATTIKNYPVQGFGADLVMLARIEAYKRFKVSGLPGKFVMTVHDSLVYDTAPWAVQAVAKLLKESVEAVPRLCKEQFDYDFSLPLTAEIQVGKNKKEMKELDLEALMC